MGSGQCLWIVQALQQNCGPEDCVGVTLLDCFPFRQELSHSEADLRPRRVHP